MALDKPAAERIAVLLPSLTGGGAQRRIVDLVNSFVELGREVDLLVIDSSGELKDRVAPKVGIVVVGGGTDTTKLEVRAAIRRHLVRRPPDVFLSGSAYVQSFAIAAVEQVRSFPLVLRADSHPRRAIPWSLVRQRVLEPFRQRKRLAQYACADLVIAVSDDVAAAIRNANPDVPVVMIRNPVISTSFRAGARLPLELPWPDDPSIPLIVGIGRLTMAKDFPTLLRAFAQVRKRCPARLAILGEGSQKERERMLRLAKQLHLQDSFVLVGSSDRVAAWLRRADVFVSSSIWEGCQGALIEALAVGCPIVATDSIGSSRDLLKDRRLGLLVPARKPKAMAHAIAEQLDHASQHQRDLLIEAAEPYQVGRSAADYLAAMDGALEKFRSKLNSTSSEALALNSTNGVAAPRDRIPVSNDPSSRRMLIRSHQRRDHSISERLYRQRKARPADTDKAQPEQRGRC